EPGPQAVAGTTRKRWLPMALLLVAVVAMGWWWQSKPADKADANTATRLTTDAGAVSVSGEMVTEQAATIIEETLPASMASTAGSVANDGSGNSGVTSPTIHTMLDIGQPAIVATRHTITDDPTTP